MSAVAVLHYLLVNNANLLAVVPAASVYSGALPERTTLPAISVMEVTAAEVPHIDGTAPTTIVEGHAQITVAAADYPTLQSVLALARKACNYQHGSINSFTVISVRRIGNGPDLSDVSAKFYMKSLDMAVTYHETN